MDDSGDSKVILDLTEASTSGFEIQDEPDESLFGANEEEQRIVNKFLEGEMEFEDYIQGISTHNLPEDTEIFEVKPTLDATKKEKFRKNLRKLPPALKGLMGEANLRIARGDKETAVKICLEIIREVPTAAEPFLTLACIYEEMGDEEKFLQMSLVAAHLSPTDVFQWVYLAELSEKQNLIKQAISCYTKAINLDLENLNLHQKRAVLLESIGDKKTPIKGYIRLLCSLKPEQGESIMSLAKLVAQLCHKENDVLKASTVLDIAIKKTPQSINPEIINLQLELLLQLKNYKACLELMQSFCDLVIEVETDEQDNMTIINCVIPEETPIDIISKAIVVLIYMKANHLVRNLIQPIMNVEPSSAGDLYLDIIDAYVENSMYEEAHSLLDTLIQSKEYCLPLVWLKYAENLKNLNKFEEASVAYYKVVEQVPEHVDARMTLASLLVELGKPDEAINVLTQNEEYDSLDVGLLYEKCTLLKQNPNRSQELIMVGQVLFSRHSTQIRNRDELSTISLIQRYEKKRVAVKQVRKCRQESEGDNNTPTFRTEKGPSVEEEWELFKHICTLCIENKMYITFQRLTFTAQLSTVFHIYKSEINILSVIAAYLNNDSHNGYNIIRTLVVKDRSNVKLWNLFNLLIAKSADARHNRFIMRLLARDCNHPALGVLHGNNCLVSGTYKYAMHEYNTTYSKNPTPLGALILGLTYLQMAAQKFTSKKHHLVLQALGLFGQYRDKRGPQGIQEVHYNLARGFHHLGIFTSAIYHYKKVFEFNDLKLCKQRPGVFDLSREAAFNLHLIYCQSESYDLARMYLAKYIVV